MPLYDSTCPQYASLTVARVVDGKEELWHGGVVRVHTEQDWAEVLDLEETKRRIERDPSTSEFDIAITRTPGLWVVYDRKGNRNPPPDVLP